ncbi:MAG: MlaD family protein [Chloroherpetonaceae bacterium]|nr:MlaD family protein [Chloroherpetonaceae bacterium]MCS7210378.1 MlaD family protein [Chloroherpetonaceae bacterium]MDW8018946.1 MlaD family protein [Chloroherpetonaceae bacterium]
MAETAKSALTSEGVRWRDVRTGILFVLGVAIMGILALVIGKNTSALSKKVTYKVLVPDITGLAENNLVSVAGKKVGTVLSLDFATPNDTTIGVEITLLVNQEYAYLFREGSKATIVGRGILGDKLVAVIPGRGRPLAPGSYLDYEPAEGLEAVLASVHHAVDSVNALLAKLNRGEGTLGKLLTSEDLLNRLTQTVAHLEQATAALTQGKGLVPRLLNDHSLADNVESITRNLNEVSHLLKRGDGTLGKFLVDDSFYHHLSSVVQRLDTLLTRLENPNGTLGKLTNDAALYRNLSSTAASLDSLLNDLRRNPSRYVTIRVF